ncbi:MAG: ribosomal protein S18-alanine N-acetyltransferase [Microbacteriaceae bacterium]
MIRRAGAGDLAAIMAIETTTFADDAWSAETMRAELASEHAFYLVDDEGGAVVGYAGLLAPAGASEGDIQTIAVAAAARGRGRGRALMDALGAEARRRGVRELFLEVRADNPLARSLYASLGFERIAERPHYYQPDDVAAIVMRSTLAGQPALADPGETSEATA